MKLAITGGTGFVGSHLIDSAMAAGHTVKALTRREQPVREQLEWVSGSLDDRDAVRLLVTDADAVIHVAGVINAPDAAAFDEGNVAGTLSMLAAATAGGVHRFIHVSSLAAREPTLSLYGASKARAEELVTRSGLDWDIVRPPAVYGPGDKETLELFRMAKLGMLLMPPAGRLSLLHVADLAALLIALVEPEPGKLVIEADDGRTGGWSHREFGRALGMAVGTRPLIMSSPAMFLRLAARADQLVRGQRAKLTADRAAYFSHRNWVVDPKLAPPAGLWRPQIETIQGLKDTATWYRQKAWL